MKKILYILLAIVIIVGASYYFRNEIINSSAAKYIGTKLGYCMMSTDRGNMISPETAQAVALVHVNENNKPFKWVPVGYYVLYTLSGSIDTYTFVFRKSDFNKFTTLESLEQNATLYSNTTSEEGEKKYQFDNIANVTTGAAEGDKLIDGFRRGLPDFFALKVEIRKFIEDTYHGKTIGNAVYGGPGLNYEIIDKSSGKPTGEYIDRNNVITSRSELVSYRSAIESRKVLDLLRLGKRYCDIITQSQIAGQNDLKSQWSKYSR